MKGRAKVGFVLGVVLLLGGCGPEVNIIEPQEGDVLPDSTVTALMEFTSAARTFEVSLDGNDVSANFFVTDEEAGGTISGVSNGEHILQVSYTSTSGFSDTDSVIFSVGAPEVVDLVGIAASPSPLELVVDETGSLTVTGAQSDGSTVDLTADADTIYLSEDGTIVSVGTGGAVAGVGPGSTVITVQNGDFTAVIDVTVTEAAS